MCFPTAVGDKRNGIRAPYFPRRLRRGHSSGLCKKIDIDKIMFADKTAASM